MCKAELGQDRDNLNLWIIYARLERQKSNLGSARAVYSTVLSNTVTQTSTTETLELWAEWAMMEWSLGEEGRCREVLLRHVDRGATGECKGPEAKLTERLPRSGSVSNVRTICADTSQS